MMDLRRLKVYVNERVKESARLSHANVTPAIQRAHAYSEMVGKQVLDEIDAELVAGQLSTGYN